LAIRKIGGIGRTYRHVQRYRQILGVLIRYGFGDLVDNLKVEHYIEIGLRMVARKRREKIERLSRAVRVRMMFEELGPTFIKMGQILSTRPDLLAESYTQELAKLQDSVPPFAWDDVKRTVEKELRSPLGQVFERFDEQPLAAASLGQVHAARLHAGEEVVVKVQRPAIREVIEVDLEIILHLATLMERHLDGWDVQRPTKIVEEFARTLEQELDYTIEASHIERFARQFTSDPRVYVLRVYRDASSSRVLTMERVDGIKISEVDRLEQAGLDRKELARRGADLTMHQVFVDGFFHADPHPGNIVALPDDTICYLDFGMMGRIDREARENLADLFLSMVRRDESRAVDALLGLTLWDEEPERAVLRREVSEFIDRHFYQSLKKLEIGRLLQRLLAMVSAHRLQIPPDRFLMLKALSTIEDLGHRLDPDFDLAGHAGPFVRSVLRERMHPRRLAGDVVESVADFLRLLQDLPHEVREIVRQARKGKITMAFEHRGLDPMLSVYDRVSNRIAFALVLGSLVIGSSLIVLADIPPKWHGMPVIGLAGFVVAALMGFWLLVSIMKHGRM
jgi:ubiquinone biosynthesis protein